MAFQRVHQSSPQKTQTQQNTSWFAPRPLTVQAQLDTDRLPAHLAHSEVQSLEQAARFGYHFANISVLPPDTHVSTPVQRKQVTDDQPLPDAEQRPNQTGLPDHLKAGIEHLSGFSLDKVKVYYNSDRPAQLNALAYAQGTNIHVAPGQEQHLPHEAWHVVQQAQGRVQPTMQLKDGVPVNDNDALEDEADVMGAKAVGMREESPAPRPDRDAHSVLGSRIRMNDVGQRATRQVLQCRWKEGVNGPPNFDPGEAVTNANWSNPKYVSVNLGSKQPDDIAWKSYRITAWAPAQVGKWEVTVAAHVYFEANASTKKVKRTQFGHYYVNDWEDWSGENDTIREAIYNNIKSKLFEHMDQVSQLVRDSSVTVVGKYDRASFRPRRTAE